MTDLKQLKALAEGASKGKWINIYLGSSDWSVVNKDDGEIFSRFWSNRKYVGPPPDLEYIAAANPQTILGLLEEREAMVAERTKLLERLSDAEAVITLTKMKDLSAPPFAEVYFKKWKGLRKVE